MKEDKKENRSSQYIEEETSFGPFVAAIIIVVLLILGGLYALGKNSPQDPLPLGAGIARDSVIDSILLYDTSDDLEKIQRDLAATSIQALERGLDPLTKDFE